MNKVRGNALIAGATGHDCLYPGNLNARRDWGDARNVVYGMWLMLQQDEPGDWVLSAGKNVVLVNFLNQLRDTSATATPMRVSGL